MNTALLNGTAISPIKYSVLSALSRKYKIKAQLVLTCPECGGLVRFHRPAHSGYGGAENGHFEHRVINGKCSLARYWPKEVMR